MERFLETQDYKKQLENAQSKLEEADRKNRSLEDRYLTLSLYIIKVPIAPNYKGVCLQNTSKSHLYHLKI